MNKANITILETLKALHKNVEAARDAYQQVTSLITKSEKLTYIKSFEGMVGLDCDSCISINRDEFKQIIELLKITRSRTFAQATALFDDFDITASEEQEGQAND